MTKEELLNDTQIKENISKMLNLVKREPKTEKKETYKTLEIHYIRNTVTGTWCAYITIPLHHFIYTIKNKQKEMHPPILATRKQFPEITFYKHANNVTRYHILGVSTTGLPPYNYQVVLPLLQVSLAQQLIPKNRENEVIDILRKYNYVSFKNIKNKMHEIVDFIIDKTTPQELKYFICYKCKQKTKLVPHRLYKGHKVCSVCYQHLSHNRFIPMSKITKGKFYTKKINNKTYYACHVCGLLTKSLFTHSTTKHGINRQEYSKLYDIDFTIPRKNGGYYPDRNIYHSAGRNTTTQENIQFYKKRGKTK